MKSALALLFAVAAELADLAKSSMPEMRKNEVIKREWLEDGIYYRETVFNNETYQVQFDFRKRKCRIVTA